MYTSTTAWHYEGLFVDVLIPDFATYQDAERFGRDTPLKLALALDNGTPRLLLTVNGSQVMEIERSQCELSVELGDNPPALDPRIPEQLEEIWEALEDPHSPYWAHPRVTDMSFDAVLAWFGKERLSFESLAYGVREDNATETTAAQDGGESHGLEWEWHGLEAIVNSQDSTAS